MLTSLQALVRLAVLQRLGVFICALATLLSATGNASALETAQTKTRVWGFDFASANSIGLFGAANSGKHQGNCSARAELASGSLLAAEGAGSVIMDTNAVIAAVEKGQGAILAGRTPVVPITAVKEFLRGGGSADALRSFLSANGGRVGLAGTEVSAGALRTQAAVAGRVLGVGDARVAASAQREGLSVLTQDRSFRNFLNWVGIGGENF